MLKSIGMQNTPGVDIRVICVHWKSFPPVSAIRKKPVIDQRKEGEISEAEYQQHLVWERDCGILRMDKRKCRYCKHARQVTQKGPLWGLQALDGTGFVPIVDSYTLENLAFRLRKKGY